MCGGARQGLGRPHLTRPEELRARETHTGDLAARRPHLRAMVVSRDHSSCH